MPTKKQDVTPEELTPQAEEMLMPEDVSTQTDSENEKPGATRARKSKRLQIKLSLTQNPKRKPRFRRRKHSKEKTLIYQTDNECSFD